MIDQETADRLEVRTRDTYLAAREYHIRAYRRSVRQAQRESEDLFNTAAAIGAIAWLLIVSLAVGWLQGGP